ncbi:MAG: sensor histidine kinase, partial [Deltaproteobacteria bacterium]
FFVIEMEKTKKGVEQWRTSHSERISQALFLKNNLDLKELLQPISAQKQVEGFKLNVVVFDQKLKEVMGTGKVDSKIRAPVLVPSVEFQLTQAQVLSKSPLKIGDSIQGYLWVIGQWQMGSIYRQSVFVLLGCALLFVMMRLGVSVWLKWLDQSVLLPIQRITQEFEKDWAGFQELQPINWSLTSFERAPSEIEILVSRYNELVRILKSQRIEENRFLEARTRLEVASQVAHDIRSPMAALSLALEDLSEVSIQKKEVLIHVLKRMDEISRELLKKEEKMINPNSEMTEAITKVEVKPILESIIAEKKVLFIAKNEVSWGALNLPTVYVFARETELKRVLSNLIDNAVQAISQKGEVSFKLTVSQGIVYLSVRDNGKGMSKEMIQKVGERGFSFDKPNGHGLGLSLVKQFVESWGGKVAIDSAPGKGTVVSLQLRSADEPNGLRN